MPFVEIKKEEHLSDTSVLIFSVSLKWIFQKGGVIYLLYFYAIQDLQINTLGLFV